MLKRIPIKQFFQFCTVGGIGTVIQFALTWLLTEKAHLYYLLSLAIAVGVAVSWNFFANYRWTFKKEKNGLSKSDL